jgi:hypothetical protein
MGGPIDDPALADRANPRWDDPTAPQPDAQPLTNEDGTPNVMPPETVPAPAQALAGSVAAGMASSEERIPPEDQAARMLEGRDEPGSDNIREGRGGGTPNPALAEGGDHG